MNVAFRSDVERIGVDVIDDLNTVGDCSDYSFYFGFIC
jgi:hypothetical protein